MTSRERETPDPYRRSLRKTLTRIAFRERGRECWARLSCNKLRARREAASTCDACASRANVRSQPCRIPRVEVIDHGYDR